MKCVFIIQDLGNKSRKWGKNGKEVDLAKVRYRFYKMLTAFATRPDAWQRGKQLLLDKNFQYDILEIRLIKRPGI